MAISQDQTPMLASVMASPEELGLYKIDYSTTLTQPKSKLCNIPDEVLLEIGKLVFADFGLEFRTDRTLKDDDHVASVSLKPGFPAANLHFLRSCKVLRQKLLPLLSNTTDHTLVVSKSPFEPLTFLSSPSDLWQQRGPTFRNLKLANPFLARIRQIAIPGRPPFLPSPFYFENLERIDLTRKVAILASRDTWEDNTKLLSLCQETLQEPRGSTVRRLLGYLDEELPAKQSWVLQLVDDLQAHDKNNSVKVIISVTVYERVGIHLRDERFLGQAMFDVTAGSVTRDYCDICSASGS